MAAADAVVVVADCFEWRDQGWRHVACMMK